MSDQNETKSDDYREGDEETAPAVTDEHEDQVQVVPITAFLIVKLPNKVDVVTELPGMDVQHLPTSSDVRDMAHTVYEDAQASVIASRAAQTMTSGLAKAAQMQAVRQQMGAMIRPKG